MNDQEDHIRVEARDGKLIVTAPKRCLSPEIVGALREHKAELVEYLARFGGQGVVQVQAETDTGLGELACDAWAAWKARALNRLFQEQGATGRLGRITAATVAHGEQHKVGSKLTTPLSLIYLPDKPDILGVTGCVEDTYQCRVSEMDPTSPDISTGKPDKVTAQMSSDPVAAGVPASREIAIIDDTLTTATFPHQIQVELCRDDDTKTRWLMWVTQRGRRTRRKDFATPFLDHGRRAAEQWYGKTVSGWSVPEGGRPVRLAPRSAIAATGEGISGAQLALGI